MEITKIVTISMLVISVTIWIIWDILVAINKIPGDTISELILSGGSNSLLLVATLGTVVGHFFWTGQRIAPNGYFTVGSFIIIGLLWLSFDIHWWLKKDTILSDGFFKLLRHQPIIVFAFHVLVGHFLWAQKAVN